jgi:hypothetical protein
VIIAVIAMLAGDASGSVVFEWVEIGEADLLPNDPDTNGRGSVGELFLIARKETTCSQYAEFLNAVARSDPNGLYHALMGSDATFGGITRSGSEGSYSYAAKAGMENQPVVYVSFYVDPPSAPRAPILTALARQTGALSSRQPSECGVMPRIYAGLAVERARCGSNDGEVADDLRLRLPTPPPGPTPRCCG